jgi:hypothetical protein
LKSIALLGDAKYPIDPYRGDLFKTAIDLRSSVKAQAKLVTGHRKAELDAEQLALKILANSTSYGIFVEVNVSDLDKADSRNCFGPSGEAFTVETQKSEEPGRYFHPLLATLITGAARLMLAIAERLTLDSGLDWAFATPTAWLSPNLSKWIRRNSSPKLRPSVVGSNRSTPMKRRVAVQDRGPKLRHGQRRLQRACAALLPRGFCKALCFVQPGG